MTMPSGDVITLWRVVVGVITVLRRQTFALVSEDYDDAPPIAPGVAPHGHAAPKATMADEPQPDPCVNARQGGQ